MDLLPPALFIELDDFDQEWIGKIRYVRVIEGKMSVLADPHADDIDSDVFEER